MTMKRLCGALAALIALSAAPAFAQEAGKQSKADEIKELQALLAKVEKAIGKIEPLIKKTYVFAQYDLRQLFFRAPDRIAPRLTIPGSNAGYRTGSGGGGGAAGGVLSFGDSDEEESYEGALLDPEKMVEIIYAETGEDHWESPASLEVSNGFLLVKQTPLLHSKVRRLLEDLRAAALRSIQLEVGFYSLSEDLKTAIAVESKTRGGALSQETLKRVDAAVARGEAKLVGHSLLSALSNQRIYLHTGAERNYVATFEEMSGGTGPVVKSVAMPIVEVLRTGLSLDIVGTVLEGDDKPRVALDARFLRSDLILLDKRKSAWGAIDIPQIKVDSVRTSARVPAGEGMLIFSSDKDKTDSKETGEQVFLIVRPRIIKTK